MASNAKTGLGAKLYIGDAASPEVFTAVAEIRKMTKVGAATAALVDVTNMDSTGGYDETITGLKTGGTISLEMNFNGADTGQVALLTAFEGQVRHNYRIDLPDANLTRLSFAAFVASAPSADVDPKAAMTGSVDLKVTGAVTRSTHS
jgi:predicted secreted protein